MSTTLAWPPAWIKVQSEGIKEDEKEQIVKSEFQRDIAQTDRKPRVIKKALDNGALKEWRFENISTVVGNEDFEVYVSASGKCVKVLNTTKISEIYRLNYNNPIINF